MTRSLASQNARLLVGVFLIFELLVASAVVVFLMLPMARSSAADLASLMLLSAQTWSELPPETRPAFEHIDNNHKGLSKEQIVDLMRVNDQVEAIFDKINDMLRTKDFSDLDMVLEMRDKLFDTIVEAIKSQLRRINGDETVSTRASVLYLTILNETKTMILQARNLLKSQHYFLEHKK